MTKGKDEMQVIRQQSDGRRYYRPFCSEHWSKYCYVVWKRARMREAMGLTEAGKELAA